MQGGPAWPGGAGADGTPRSPYPHSMPDNDRPARDGLESGLRLGCGGLLGLFLAAGVWFGLAEEHVGRAVAVTAVSVVLCAWLAWRYGDRFWRWAAETLAYVWPFPWP